MRLTPVLGASKICSLVCKRDRLQLSVHIGHFCSEHPACDRLVVLKKVSHIVLSCGYFALRLFLTFGYVNRIKHTEYENVRVQIYDQLKYFANRAILNLETRTGT